MTQFKNMMLVKGTVSHDGKSRATFKMIPLTAGCPYLEVIYHPIYRGLGMVLTHKKNAYEMIPSLDKEGNPIPKKKKVQQGEYPYVQERRMLENWHENVILTKEEMDVFINMFAINADSFDKEQFMKEPEPTVITPQITAEPIKKAEPAVEMKTTVTPEKEEKAEV